MALDYGLSDEYGFADEDAAMMGGILTAKVTVETTEAPADYSGVPKTTTTTEEIPIIPDPPPQMLMPGPAPMMMAAPPPPLGVPQMAAGMNGGAGVPPGMAPGMMPPQAAPGMMPPMAANGGASAPSGSMGVNAAQQVMQQFG